MISITIDNHKVAVKEGDTILKAAEKAGIVIPTLCHKDGVEHYSSCMVCIVKDIKKNSFLPSCSAMAKEGMEIDASGEAVIMMRKKAVSMLLTEHRAECEAPCRIVCPAGYNIPLMNRMLTAADYEGATNLIRSETAAEELKCISCKAYCENACRRKKIDEPLSIRNTRIFIYEHINRYVAADKVIDNNLKPVVQKNASIGEEPNLRKRFFSKTGRIEDNELKEWLKECSGDGTRYRVIDDFESASKEAGSCMHCDCRAASNCRLREIAESLSLKDPSGKIVNLPLAKKINHRSGLIFENGKCIKCGLCVRVCEDSKEEPVLCFINRGFISVISEPLTEEFDNTLITQTDICVSVCPTGALAKFR
ncbi:MAG TPA: 2Fe-2S iron-sulfur cluster-binding protein [Bacteroidales bacterium]|nr:2Fe-2S iron-sulfur cluster-binding protein [Bacteroidales bacterium]HQK67475.1 2Fe-2S iron-sulfur cluster-binding protein [Bacteroidales bacterium]